MSDFDQEKNQKQPPVAAAGDDPWAKWRKPDAAPAPEPKPRPRPAVDAENRQKIETPPVVSVVPQVRERPTGTLSPKKQAPAVSTVAKKPFRKPGATPANSPWSREGGRDGNRDARPARTPQAAPIVRAPKPRAPDQAPARDPADGVRLSKVMSERGICSRREADLWIERGWVFVNGEQISELGTRIDPSADINISKEAVKDQAKAVTILLHKPVGYVSGQPEPGSVPAVTLITAENQVHQSGGPEFKPWMLRGLAPAGRLDVDSTGLLVLTSDGRVAKRLIGEDSEAEKEYLVRVSGEIIKGGLEMLRHGLELDGKPLKTAWVKQLNEDQLHFILKEGKKRQIRRMCELVGLRVTGLKRVRIGRIRLGELPMGQWRFLRADEAF